MKKDADGKIVPDLAESYTVSPDGLTYTFVLKDAKFQDGQKITSDDVLFTIKAAIDPILKSPERIKWSGIAVQAVNEKTVSFTLKHAYAPFLQNAVLGILPKHLWSKISYENWAYSDLNTKKAIGAGGYQIKTISQNSSGIPDSYQLKSVSINKDATPRIRLITIHFYPSEAALVDAFKSGSIDTAGGIDPKNAALLAKNGAHVLQSKLPRVFGLFFNQSQAKIFTDSRVRQAIDLAIHKDRIVADVLKGYGSGCRPPRRARAVGRARAI
jgi:ABC-type transport system substrate-binding protein